MDERKVEKKREGVSFSDGFLLFHLDDHYREKKTTVRIGVGGTKLSVGWMALSMLWTHQAATEMVSHLTNSI